MHLVDGTFAVRAGDDRYPDELEELKQHSGRFADQAALSDQDYRALCGEQQVERPLQRVEIAGGALIHQWIGIGYLDFGRFLEHIERYIDIYRPRPPARNRPKACLMASGNISTRVG